MKSAELNIQADTAPTRSMHPQKFALWLFIVSIVMLFAAMTSAYVVKKSDGEWLIFDLPNVFVWNSLVIVASSVSLQWAYFMAKKNSISRLKIGLWITAVLGLIFIYGQYYSWGKLVENNVYFVGNPAGSFVYVLTGLHAFHLISAIIFVFIVIYQAYKYKVHSKSMVRIEMCTTYWHFLGGLWLYLYGFLLIN